jgi:glycosyltransferase involved in cell wall biosynthesis
MGLRIAIFTDSYLPYNSGVVHSIEVLHREVSLMGHQVFIFAPRYPNYIDNEENVFRFISVPPPTNPDYYLAIPFSRHLKATLKEIQPDVIHVHHPFGLGWLGLSAARQLGIPLVYTFHTLYEYYSHYLPIPRRMARLLIRKICANFSNRCNVIIAPTTATAEYMRQLGVTKPLKVIPTGIKTEEFMTGETGWLRRRYDIKPREKILLCVGRLGPEKNIAFLLECFAEIVNDFPETRLVLVGKGPQEKELKRLAQQLTVQDKVTFTGLLTRAEVYKCYLDADIFVFASISETQGLVIPEAKFAGLPVVAVRANGVSEMVQDGVDGFLTDLSKEIFSEKIKLLLQNEKLREEMGRNALQNANKFSARNYALNILKVYSLFYTIFLYCCFNNLLLHT